jgi:hypothetical protein
VQSLEALSKFKLRARAATLLKVHAAAWARGVSEAVVVTLAPSGAAASPALLAHLEHHAGAHIEELGRLLNGGAVHDFDFVRQYARQRATQRFPIEATLQAYRGMLPLLAQWLVSGAGAARSRDRETAVAALANFVAQYIGAISIAFAAAYAAHASVFAEAEGDPPRRAAGRPSGRF